MPRTLAHAMAALEAQVETDPSLAEAVVFLAGGPEGPDDPFGEVPAGALGAARVVNERRRRMRRQAAASGALDTAGVVDLLGSVNDRKGVDRRRRRGQLLGWRAGARTLHPDWQFDRRRGETRPGLAAVVAALGEVTADPEAADALMRAPREDLGGASLADAFAAGALATVLRLIRASAEQS